MDKKKSFKAYFKNGSFHYKHEGLSDEAVDKLKFLIEGQTVYYRVKNVDKDQRVKMETLASKEEINPIVFKKGNCEIGSGKFNPDYPDFDVLEPFEVKSLFASMEESGKYDPETFVFEVNNFKARQKGRVISHKNKHFILYYGTLQWSNPDYVFNYPNHDGRVFGANMLGVLGREGLIEVIQDEGLMPQSLYLRLTLKKELQVK